MSEIHYVVVQRQGGWAIRHKGSHSGPYPTQFDAVRAAIDAAQMSGRHGLDAQVLIEAPDNDGKVRWIFVRDPYPALRR